MERCGSNKETVKAFLNGNLIEGRADGANLFFEEGVLYSYGHHFPIAVEKGDYYLVNTDKYSKTTSSHQSLVGNMLPNGIKIEIPFYEFMKLAHLAVYRDTARVAKEINIIYYDGEEVLFGYEGEYFRGKWEKTKTGKKKAFLLEKVESKEEVEKYLKEE